MTFELFYRLSLSAKKVSEIYKEINEQYLKGLTSSLNKIYYVV